MEHHTPPATFGTRLTGLLDNPFTAALLYPRTFDEFVELINPTWTRQELRARVVSVVVDDTTTALTVRAGRGVPSAWQSLEFIASVDGRRTARNVKIARREGDCLTLEFDRADQDSLVRWAGENASVGDVVVIGQPAVETRTEQELHFVRSEMRVHADASLPILVQAERAGLRPAAGCRRGVCHRCACTLSSGSVRNVKTGEVSSERGAVIRPCISLPIGRVEVDL